MQHAKCSSLKIISFEFQSKLYHFFIRPGVIYWASGFSCVKCGRWRLDFESHKKFMSMQIIMTHADAWWPMKQFVGDAFVAGRMIICRQGIVATGII
jgi:hypothetical protein